MSTSKMNTLHRINRCLVATITILILTTCQEEQTPSINFESKVIQLAQKSAQKAAVEIRKAVALEVHEDFEVSLWASDSLLADPIAISIDPQGRIYYTSATRQANSEFDIRSHRNWMTASISFKTVEDRRKFLRETFSEENEEGKKFLKDLNKDGTLDWKDLAEYQGEEADVTPVRNNLAAKRNGYTSNQTRINRLLFKEAGCSCIRD